MRTAIKQSHSAAVWSLPGAAIASCMRDSQQGTVKAMFGSYRCAVDGCRNYALTEDKRCGVHVAQRRVFMDGLQARFERPGRIEQLSLSFLQFDGNDFSRKVFINCDFSHGSYSSVNFSESTFVLCFFAASTFEACNFRGSTMQNCLLALSSMDGVDFTGSTLVQDSFNCCKIRDSDFSDSDLMNSRFIGASIAQVRFSDCNLKGADFTDCEKDQVDFKYSNTEDALFGASGSEEI